MFSGHLEVLSLCGRRLTFLGANLSVFILPGICYTLSCLSLILQILSHPSSHYLASPPFPLISSYWDPSLVGFSVHAVSNSLNTFRNVFSLCNRISVNSLVLSSKLLMISWVHPELFVYICIFISVIIYFKLFSGAKHSFYELM